MASYEDPRLGHVFNSKKFVFSLTEGGNSQFKEQKKM